jgi:tRNA(Ile)-lysidine synthase
MLTPGETVVVGVSGGADSVGLLHLLTELDEYKLKLIIAHLNHGIRPKEGKRDAEFVKEIARVLKLPLELKEVKTLEFKKRSNLSLEEAGRVLRYSFFREVLGKYQAQKIATAHTLDDQAETVLMRILRGSGGVGLSGIPPVSEGYIIRPLIETSRSHIEKFLRMKKVGWVQDSTNWARDFLRNRIRLELIPELQKYNPKIKETLSRTAKILRIEEDFIKKEAEKQFELIFGTLAENELIGAIPLYKNIPEAMRLAVLRLAVEKIKGSLRKVTFDHIFSADKLLLSLSSSGETSLPDGIIVVKGYDHFLVTRKSELRRKFSYKVPSTGKWSFPEVEFEVEITKVKVPTEDKSFGFFDANTVEFPIEVRNFQPGDRFVPLGMKSSKLKVTMKRVVEPPPRTRTTIQNQRSKLNTKKVKRFFIDEKVPRFLRNRIPIFLSRGRIIWVGGMRIDDRFKLVGKKAVKIKLIRPKPWKKQVAGPQVRVSPLL